METLTTTITPDVRICGQTIQLSPIDQIAPRDYSVAYLFFPLNHDANKVRIFQELEIALERTAETVPQIVSVVRKRQNNRGELELEYNSSHGAHLSLKDYTTTGAAPLWPHGSFSDLAKEHFPMSKLERHLLLNIDHSLSLDNFDSLPGLCVQASFIEGGLILSCCLHHTMCDGTGNAIFHETFARELCHLAGATLPKAPTLQPSMAERTTIVQPTEDATHLQDFPHWKLADDDKTFLNPVAYDSAPVPVRYSIFFISEQNIQRLRKRVNTESNSNFSALDAACAFLWMHVVRARSPDPEVHPTSKLSITVDARTRMTDSQVANSYWGNFSEPNAVACLPTSFFGTNALENMEDAKLRPVQKSLQQEDWRTKIPHAASKITQAIRAVDNVALRRLVGLLAQMPKATSLTWNVNRWPGPDMLIVCTNKLPLTTLQYGSLGCSEAARITVGNTEEKPDGRCLLLPSRKSDGRGMEIALQYDLATLERLKDDAEFAEYMEWRN